MAIANSSDRISIAFLNCRNLFDVRSCARAPKTDDELQFKIERLSEMIRSLELDPDPTVLCYCEVGNIGLGLSVANRAFPDIEYEPVWSNAGKLASNQTGLLILRNPKFFGEAEVLRDRPMRRDRERSRWLAAEFPLKNLPSRCLWVILNHWSSSHPSESEGEYQRRRTSEEIASLFQNGKAGIDPHSDIVILGDFNCEPTDEVFRLKEEGAWKVSPNSDAVEKASKIWPCFYNPIVKEPGIFGTIPLDKYGLHHGMWDQMIFSRSLIDGPDFRYVSGSICLTEPLAGASDHAAIGVILEYSK
jgi:hypothetical protein